MNNPRWDPSIFLRGPKASAFWAEHFNTPNKKLLFILGKGFDIRMNIALSNLLNCCPHLDITCWMIEFDEGSSSNSVKYQAIVEENHQELKDLLKGKPLNTQKIPIWHNKGKGKKQRIGDRQATQILSSFDQISEFTDIIIDISALPRSVYFSLVGKFLAILDHFAKPHPANFFVVVSENAAIDIKIKEKEIDEDIGYLHGFGGGLEITSDSDKPIIWFPILGEDKVGHMDKAFGHILPDEICPVLPFPSKNPRRSDALIIEYHQLLFDKLVIEPQNLMYVPEQNPFEAYERLSKAIRNYNESLNALNGCKAVISSFSSKLLSIGALLTAYELKDKIGVGILNVDSQGYEINSFEDLKNLKKDSEVFVIWLTGEPYHEATTTT